MIIIKKNKFLIVYSSIIILFSLFILWDTFLNTKVYQVVSNTKTINEIDKDNNSSKSKKNSLNKKRNKDKTSNINTDSNTTEKSTTNNSYKDKNIEIKLTEYFENDTKIYVADIILNNSKYLKTAFANSSYGKNVTDYTSSISESVNAILAINGDYYRVQEKGYVLKQGVIYRDTPSDREDLVIYSDGSFSIINEKDISLEKLLENGAYNILSFGPALIDNNKISVSETDEVGKSMESNPRTSIGIIDKNHYVFVVSDGRTTESVGLSLYELATFMKSLNCTIAYNLDGGGSSTMYFNGNIINNPTTTGSIKERKVSDIVYIGY